MKHDLSLLLGEANLIDPGYFSEPNPNKFINLSHLPYEERPCFKVNEDIRVLLNILDLFL